MPTRPARHTRIPDLPYIHSLSGARLRTFYEDLRGARRDLVVHYDELSLDEPPELLRQDAQIYERVKGRYVPRRLRYTGLHSVVCDGLFTSLDDLPLDHPVRALRGVLTWISANDRDLFSLFSHGSDEPARLWVKSRGCMQEPQDGTPTPVEFLRDWSPPPPFRPGLVPQRKRCEGRYGGDPVTFFINGRPFHQRLFVGGIDYQGEQRPLVDAVLNVGEEPSRWAKAGSLQPADRFVTRGEGSQGMSIAELTAEAAWVIERLRKGQRVLVHCVAGLNRSTSICCAVLILLESLTAQAALDRVRDQHAWARPDEHHWLMLQWLARQAASGIVPAV